MCFAPSAEPPIKTARERISGLTVTDLSGARLSIAQSLKREGSRQLFSLAGNLTVFFSDSQAVLILSLASLVIEIADLAWMSRSPLKQTLHDQMAGTLVYHRITAKHPVDLTSQPKWY